MREHVLAIAQEGAVRLFEEIREHARRGRVDTHIARTPRRNPYSQRPVAQFMVARKVQMRGHIVSSDKIVVVIVLRTEAVLAVVDGDEDVRRR